MQALYDLLPVLAFYAAFKVAGIYVATAVLMAITVAQVLVQWIRTRTVNKILLVFAALALVFGGLTLWIHDDRFIVWKPTVVYTLFGIAMLVSPLVADKPLIQMLLDKHLKTDARTWLITNTSWALLWFAIALGNAVFATRYSRDAWVNWHTAITPIVFLFGIVQALWLARRAEATEASSSEQT